MEIMAAPTDFLGVNYYSRHICHDPAGGEGSRILNERSKVNVSDRDWEIYPQAMYDLLVWLKSGYPFKDIYLTENGASYRDVVSPDGEVHDPKRIDFIHQHLATLLRATEAGVPLRGYFCWTLLDNFEWAFGTSSRFGLAYTDFTTQKRILKDSGKWYGEVARSNQLK
jgi:beta-glucosidase